MESRVGVIIRRTKGGQAENHLLKIVIKCLFSQVLLEIGGIYLILVALDNLIDTLNYKPSIER